MPVTTIAVDGVDAWQRASSAHFVPLRCTGASASFGASIRQSRWGDALSLARVRTDPVLVQRTDALAARSAHDDVHVAIQLRATGRIHQHDRAARMTPGTAVLYETNAPYVIDHRGAAQDLYVVHLARHALGLDDADVRRLAGRALSPALTALRVLTSTLRELDEGPDAADGPGGDAASSGLGDVVATLVRLTLQQAARGSATPPRADGDLLAAVRVTIRECASDPDFDVAALAAAHHLSERQLYRVLAAGDATPSSAIRAERLATAQRLIAAAVDRGDAARTGATVDAIAHASGFRDATTFIRGFKRAFGVTPGSLLSG